ncbi:hypothetical protein SOVF_143030 [Spinacia oleracea]|nr:hypothetical protein SOVF_143030 [Spinacia oleracea]
MSLPEVTITLGRCVLVVRLSRLEEKGDITNLFLTT